MRNYRISKSICIRYFLVLVLTFTLLSLPQQSFSVDVTNEEDEMINLMALQENACMANELIVSAFDHKENGEIIYPDNFSGRWIDGNKLVIGVTSDSEEIKEWYRNIAAEYSEYLLFQKQTYSYNSLLDLSKTIANELISQGVEVNGFGPNEVNNSVSVYISSKDYAGKILEKISDKYDVEIEYKFTEGIERTATSLYGGKGINNSSTGYAYSISCCGTYGGSPAILTCGHGSTSNGQTVRVGTTTMGSVVKHNYSNNAYGDYDVVKVTNTASFTTTNNLTGTNYYVTAAYSNPAVNTQLAYYGSTSGSVKYGTVSATGQYLQSYITDTLTVGVWISGLTTMSCSTVYAGDSGGPVFQITPVGTVNYCGIISGKINGTTTTLGFTPLSTVTYTTNFGVKTSY